MLRPLFAAALLVLLAPPARAAAPSYTDYQALLDKYVVRLDPRAKQGDTQFDYERLHVDQRIWITHRSPQLQLIHDELLSVKPSELSPPDRTAWAINTYNFLVIERATMRLLIPGKKFTRYRSVEDMRAPEGAFFSAPVGEIEGRRCTLAEFERRYVYEDTTDMMQPRARGADPRRSLALCSGHMGDPPIAPRAYTGDSLEIQLDTAVRTALSLPRFVRWHDDTHQLDVSDWLASRRIDFGGSLESIVPFVERYGPGDVRKGIHKYQVKRFTFALPVDRFLNQWPHPRQSPALPNSSS